MAARIESTPDGCWLWTGCVNSKGYGNVGIAGNVHLTHRVAYEALRGPIPPGLTVDHLCRAKTCCNPAHLELVSRAENSRRRSDSITHCAHGHRFTELTTYTTSRGTRECRICRRAQQQARREKSVGGSASLAAARAERAS